MTRGRGQPGRPAVEICCVDLAGVRAACEGGADRVEICVDLAADGLTPSLDFAAAAAEVAIAVHVLVRPRNTFEITPDQLDAMARDIEALRDVGIAGVVIGGLVHGEVDARAMRRLRERAHPLRATFHKAIDAARDPLEAIDALIDLRFDRILTAGGAGPARSHLGVLRAMADRAAGRIEIMAGGRITRADVSEIFAAGVDAVHLASGVCSKGPAGVFVDVEKVRRVVAIARGLSRPLQ